MKAVTYYQFGSQDVLKLEEIEKPTIKDDEVLISVRAASITPLDWHTLTGTPLLARVIIAGMFKPKYNILGNDIAGQVEAVGKNFNQFQPGDEVFGTSFIFGGFAEFLSVPEDQTQLVLKPKNISFEEAAAVPNAGYVALTCLLDLGQIQPGQKVLLNGASGGVGTFAVQIAKAEGAEVTGVCSTKNLDLVRSLGADRVIDYTQEDFTQGEEQYDLIFDVAAKSSYSDCKQAITPDGVYVTTAFSPGLLLMGKWVSMTSNQKLVPLPIKRPDKKDFLILKELLETGKIKPVIDKRYKLSEVPEALKYMGEGHTRGKIVVHIRE
jgi:NADPH:quinone reductase-like Zn-dependent oxidoreductase